MAKTRPDSHSRPPVWQQRLFGWVCVAVAAAYLLLLMSRGEATILPIGIAFAVGFLGSLLVFRRKRRWTSRGAGIIGGFAAAGIVWVYLAASAFQDLPAQVRAAAIGALMGATVALTLTLPKDEDAA